MMLCVDKKLLHDSPPDHDSGRLPARAGAAGVRAFADLDAARARRQQTKEGREVCPGIWDKAAALMESLGHSYALVDGNKRLTWNATWYFLGVNGHPLAEPLDEEAAFQFMYDLVRGRVTATAIAQGLRKFAAW